MSTVRGRRGSRVIVTANPSKIVRDRSSSDEVEIVSSNPIERYNHFIRQYNKDCNKVNCYTLKELPLIDLEGEATQREIDNFIRVFQSNHSQVQYNRCYERMVKTIECQNKDQYFQYIMIEDFAFDGESGNCLKMKKVMQYTQRWLEKNNKAFDTITHFVKQQKERQIHS
ncbi:hypothetical protein TTHERM_00028890 (macronuclear) [Tetrahymena thermophila SB210]|uniref:Uncharacterized protein n=1 Tax=Tetrahymena thermophila (strain SB210) TaxID=312017 RepID=Q22MY5_TETTS|nr:hypothetical protein TTHERM_00028890 [Tetrahymena thermophila SB210]EAR86492.1 hypothetical protein TTHERM_00028890 [Tetrahymena thermophila SB210]|eukprot:XP_976885.1 hypothetical protein TTHERM_00028890 [Tetrahymena thermophila SB210]